MIVNVLLIVAICAIVSNAAKVGETGLAATPAMGWNSWNHFACNISESLIKETVDALVSTGLRDLGYNYVNLDDCWQNKLRDANGNVQPDSSRFPSGLKSLGDYIHSKGMKFGIYSSAGFKTCQAFPASLGLEEIDVKSYVNWGVDYLKYDNCYEDHGTPEHRFRYMSEALKNAGRPIYFSLCEWGRENPAAWAASYGNSWRVSPDITDSWESIITRASISAPLWRYAGPGGWNDPDMLEVGNGGCSESEYVTHFSWWAMLKAPLIIGNDVRGMKADDSIIQILSNKEVIAVNQDPLGAQARRIWSDTMVPDTDLLIATKCSSGKVGAYEDKAIDQRWILQADGTIKSKSTGKCLSETGNDIKDPIYGGSSSVSTTDCASATTWEYGAFEGGFIVSKSSGQCLEVAKLEVYPIVQGKRLQTGKCQHIVDKNAMDVREHQSWSAPNGQLVNLYQRQCLTVNRDAPTGDLEIWSAPLADGSTAVMFLNKNLFPKEMTLTWDMLGWNSMKIVQARDLWKHEDFKIPSKEKITTVVPSHGSVMLKLSNAM